MVNVIARESCLGTVHTEYNGLDQNMVDAGSICKAICSNSIRQA